MPLLRHCSICHQISFIRTGDVCDACTPLVDAWTALVERMERGELSDWLHTTFTAESTAAHPTVVTHRHRMTAIRYVEGDSGDEGSRESWRVTLAPWLDDDDDQPPNAAAQHVA